MIIWYCDSFFQIADLTRTLVQTYIDTFGLGDMFGLLHLRAPPIGIHILRNVATSEDRTPAAWLAPQREILDLPLINIQQWECCQGSMVNWNGYSIDVNLVIRYYVFDDDLVDRTHRFALTHFFTYLRI